MGSFKDFYDILSKSKGELVKIKQSAADLRGGSIARQSSAATLQFPVIMSRSINVDTASSVVKALERQYATFVQMVIALNPVMNLDEDKTITDFISKIHQNNPTPIDIIESCVGLYSNDEEGIRLFTSINEGCNGAVIRSNKEQMFNIEDHLNPYKLNDLYKPKQITLSVAESSLEYFCKTHDIVCEAKHRPKKSAKNITLKNLADLGDAYNKVKKGDNPTPEGNVGPKMHERDAVVKPSNVNSDPNPKGKDIKKGNGKPTETNKNGSLHEEEFNNKLNQIDEKINNEEKNKREQEAEKAELMKAIQRDDAVNRAKAIVKLSDNDIKKCNELVPTTLSVTLQQTKGDNFGGNVNFILGIKGLMHPVNSNEMVSNLLDGHKAGNKFFNFLRWTSGEISFLKDLILNVDGIKEDVIKKHSKGSHWWTTLKRNRLLAKVKNVHSKNKILPNATIVCSMEEIMELKDVYSVDLMDPRHAMKIMDRYFLLGLVVVDESQELCYFMFDGEKEFNAMSFKGLDRENNNKNDFKDIYKMINSGRL